MATPLATAFAAFALGTLAAELAGAANLGTAASFGQIAFAAAVVALLLRPGLGRRGAPATAQPDPPASRR